MEDPAVDATPELADSLTNMAPKPRSLNLLRRAVSSQTLAQWLSYRDDPELMLDLMEVEIAAINATPRWKYYLLFDTSSWAQRFTMWMLETTDNCAFCVITRSMLIGAAVACLLISLGFLAAGLGLLPNLSLGQFFSSGLR